mgnify:CR=1 FL=1
MKQQLLKEIELGSKNALIKKRIITHYIYNGSSTITDLSKELDLSVPTVTKFISEMCDDGYINDYGKLETSGGRHPSLYGLNPKSGYFIGVDIKKFAINIGLINFKGDMVELKMNIPYKFENTQEALEKLCKLISNFTKKAGINPEKVLNICINISGRVNPESGYSFSMFNFSELPLAEVLAKKIGYSETAFVMKSDKADFKVRFFTPVYEVDLCGHATIATYNLLRDLGRIKKGEYLQETRAGLLKIKIYRDNVYTNHQHELFSFLYQILRFHTRSVYIWSFVSVLQDPVSENYPLPVLCPALPQENFLNTPL